MSALLAASSQTSVPPPLRSSPLVTVRMPALLPAPMLQLLATLTGPAMTPTPRNAPEKPTATFVEARLPLPSSVRAWTAAVPLQLSSPARISRCPPVNLVKPSPGAPLIGRSEEHTSELQSRFGISYAV